jgi:muramoyltetrapeptide carboxypeptidase
MLYPPLAPPGSIVRIVAPSGPFDESALRHGLSHLADYDVRFPPELSQRRLGFLAGDDATRLTELQAALDCPEASVVWLARGGYGLTRIAHHLDFTRFAQHPKWIVGFSDGTVLHQASRAHGVASLHAPNVTSLSEHDAPNVDSLRDALIGTFPRTWQVVPWVGGHAVGPLVGGNLTVLCMMAAAGALTIPTGAVLFLEDVDETSYRVDRMLTALVVGGYLRRVSGLVLGSFTNCSAGRFDEPTQDVLRRALSPLGVPVVAEFPSGHGAERQSWVHGGRVTLDGVAGTVTPHFGT